MEEAVFRQIVSDELVPLLQATMVETSYPSTPREWIASYAAPTRLLLKPTRVADYRVALERSQAFSPTERSLAGRFMEELASVVSLDPGAYQTDLLRAIPRRVIAAHLGGGEVLRGILGRLEEWSSQTYEGQRIVAAIGLGTTESTSGVSLSELWEQPFGPVLTNGFDTILVVGRNGNIEGLRQLSTTNVSATAPYRLREIACWAEDGKISVVLNRHGELLVFKQGALTFARRSGRWQHYVHEANIKRMSPPIDTTLRRAIYESCLDVSFARTGGCIAVVDHAHRGELGPLIAEADLLATPSSYKARLVALALDRTKFHHLDRRVRLELLSMDGALVLDHRGTFLAVGAIIEVPAGSQGGGGRTAAARRLSRLGLGMKVSADGAITGYRDDTLVLRS